MGHKPTICGANGRGDDRDTAPSRTSENAVDRVGTIATSARFARRRTVIAAAAFCMQLALGAVYGWSVFLNPLRELFEATKTEANLTFTITLAMLGVTAGFAGNLQRRFTPRAIATGAGVL